MSTNSQFEVDTAKVREASRKIKSVASQVQELASQDVQSMLALSTNELNGSTAVAIQEVLGELKGDVQRIASSLNTIQKALTTYAQKIEEKDAEMAAKING